MTKIEALELLELAARKMVEGTGLDWCCVIRDPHTHGGYNSHPTLNMRRECYELALGIIEGRPVWKGDAYYDELGGKRRGTGVGTYTKEYLDTCSWNPPAPKTVMVELTVEDALFLTVVVGGAFIDGRVATACRKALENLNRL